MQLQLILGIKRLAQIAVEPDEFGHFIVHFGRKHTESALARILGHVHGRIGATNKMVQVVSVLGTQGNTDGTSRINLDQPQADGLFEPVADAAGHVLRSEARRVGKECVSTCSYRWSPAHTKNKNK